LVIWLGPIWLSLAWSMCTFFHLLLYLLFLLLLPSWESQAIFKCQLFLAIPPKFKTFFAWSTPFCTFEHGIGGHVTLGMWMAEGYLGNLNDEGA
jgi:hypothetical protein